MLHSMDWESEEKQEGKIEVTHFEFILQTDSTGNNPVHEDMYYYWKEGRDEHLDDCYEQIPVVDPVQIYDAYFDGYYHIAKYTAWHILTRATGNTDFILDVPGNEGITVK